MLSSGDLSATQFQYPPPPPPLPGSINKKRRNRHACDPCRRKRAKCDGNTPCQACIATETQCSYTAPKKRGVPTGFLQKLETSNEKLVSLVAMLMDSLDNGYEVIASVSSRIARETPSETRERYSQFRGQVLAMLEVEDFDEMPARSNIINSGRAVSTNSKLGTATSNSIATSSNVSGTGGTPGSYTSNSSLPSNSPGNNISGVDFYDSIIKRSDSPITASLGLDTSSLGVHQSQTDNNRGTNIKHESSPESPTDAAAGEGVPDDGPDDTNPAAANSELRFLGPSSGFDESFYASFERLRLSQAKFDISTWKSLITSYSAMDLLDTYFAYTHTLFPMVDKSKLVQLLYSPDSSKKNGSGCLLWTAIMMGLNHMQAGSPNQDSYKSRIMHDLTICTLDCKYSLESVQALLIQSLYFYGKGHWSNSYLIVGNAVRMANMIGLHINPHLNVHSRRTWKCCCIIDTVISGRLGREPQVAFDNYFNVPEEETAEEWELWKNPVRTNINTNNNEASTSSLNDSWTSGAEPARTLSIFNQFYELNKLVNELISESNAPRYAKYNEQQKKRLFTKVSDQLEAWAMQLPPHCSFVEYSSDATAARLLPHKANLLLAYFSFSAILHIMDTDTFQTHEKLLSPDALVTFTLHVSSCFVTRYSFSKALPTFEYYLSLCLSIFVKTFILQLRPLSELSTSGEFNMLLDYLHEYSSTWGGCSMSYKYFSQMRKEAINFEDENRSQSTPFGFSPFMNPPLEAISDTGDYDCFELLQKTMMVSIKLLSHR